MDVVYVLGSDSHYDNDELRYSLRSIEKYLSGVGKVWIIGECADWIENVRHIFYPDQPSKQPDYNIMRKICRAIEEPELSEDFLFFNDDHFLLHPFEAETFPYFFDKTLERYLKERGTDTYGKRAKNTLDHLKSKGLPCKHFDIHYPIIYNKSLFLQHVAQAVDWSKEAYVIKSMYANSLSIEGTEAKDYKTGRELPPAAAKVFSTTPKFRYNIHRFLKEQFNEVSRYERG